MMSGIAVPTVCAIVLHIICCSGTNVLQLPNVVVSSILDDPLKPVKNMADGNEETLGRIKPGKDPSIIIQFPESVFISDVTIFRLTVPDNPGNVEIRFGSSANINENTLYGVVAKNRHAFTLVAGVGRYLSLQMNCSKCYLKIYEIYAQGFKDVRPVGHGGYYLNGKCNMIFNKMVNWTTARTRCEEEGGSSELVTINSKEENNFLLNIMVHEGIHSAWIGLRSLNSTVNWIDGDNFTYSNFNGTNGPIESCVTIGNGGSPLWNWKNCSNSMAYVCQSSASNRAVVHEKFTYDKHVDMKRTAKMYDGVTAVVCSQHCMSYTGCISFSHSHLTGECRLSENVEDEDDLTDDSDAIYYQQNHLFTMCNFEKA